MCICSWKMNKNSFMQEFRQPKVSILCNGALPHAFIYKERERESTYMLMHYKYVFLCEQLTCISYCKLPLELLLISVFCYLRSSLSWSLKPTSLSSWMITLFQVWTHYLYLHISAVIFRIHKNKAPNTILFEFFLFTFIEFN